MYWPALISSAWMRYYFFKKEVALVLFVYSVVVVCFHLRLVCVQRHIVLYIDSGETDSRDATANFTHS